MKRNSREAPSRRTKDAYHHGDLRRALREAGVELLSEVGPDFTLRQVAARVGVTHGAAYRHFESREALLAEIARVGFSELVRRLRRAAPKSEDAPTRVERVLRAYVGFAWDQPALYRVMFGRRLNERGDFPELEEAVRAGVRLLQDVVVDCLQTDDPTDARDAALGLWSLLHGFTSNVLHRRIRVRSRRAAQDYVLEVARPFLRGLRPTELHS